MGVLQVMNLVSLLETVGACSLLSLPRPAYQMLDGLVGDFKTLLGKLGGCYSP